MKMPKVEQRRKESEELLLKGLSKNKIYIWLGIVVIALLMASVIGKNQRLEEFPSFVSHSPSPTGTKALYTYISENDIAVKQWKQDPYLLSDKTNKLLLMIEPSFKLSGEDIANYEQFMEKGNTIVLFSENPEGLFQLETTFNLDFTEEQSFEYQNTSYQLDIMPMEYLLTEEDDKIILKGRYDEDEVYGLSRSYGDGELIVLKMGSPLMNGRILEAEHAEFITTFLADVYEEGQTILFDEYIREINVVRSHMQAYPFWLIVIFLQGILLTLAWLFYKGKRFGPAYTPREAEVRFSDESLVALASWHLRNKNYIEALRIQADYVKFLLYEKWHIPYQLSWGESAQKIRQKLKSHHRTDFATKLEQVLQKETMDKNDFIKWSKQLDDLRKEVETR
ncbi:MAG TPA: DUF4350 domain-containing protein [Bacillota bacterium]|nr:DUF4350 domain-containing protein [Bacillota bacterium]